MLWRQVIISYMGKYVVYLMGKKHGLVCAFSQKSYFSFFIIKMCILEKLNIYNYKSSSNIQVVFFLEEQDPKLFCDAKFANKLIF